MSGDGRRLFRLSNAGARKEEAGVMNSPASGGTASRGAPYLAPHCMRITTPRHPTLCV
jgi:hypothetical protein